MTSNGPFRRQTIPMLIAAAAILTLELFVFNLPFWTTIAATPTTAHDDGVGNGLSVESGGFAVVTDPDHAWRDISSDRPIDYLYIEHADSERPRQDDAVRWQVSTHKDTDSGWYDANADTGYSPSSEASRYARIGDGATHVRLRYQMDRGAVIPYNTITVNPHVPPRFSAIRLIVEVLTATIVIAFRPGSPFYRTRFDLRRRPVRMAVWATALVCCLVPLALFAMAAPQDSPEPVYWDYFASWQATDQYQRLAEALLKGRVWLDYPVNDALAAMGNPYDVRQRTLTALNHPEVPVYFDVAFHDGRYYSYFGVLPALLMFMPFEAVTGMRLPTNAGIAVAAFAASAMVMLLVVQVARLVGRCRDVTLGAVLLGMAAATLGDGIAILIQLGLFYQIPQEMAVAFAAGGLSCWIEAKLRGLGLPWLAAGSLCMAATIACRPQVILGTLVAVPLFADEIRTLWRDGLGGGKALLREAGVWACAAAPYLIVILAQFAYNMARFGRPTDFGASYNLTGYDMTNFHAPLTQYIPFAFYYLFQPADITAHFPFIAWHNVPLTTWRSEHPQFGGYFTAIAPFALMLFTIGVWRHALRRIAATRLIVGALGAAALMFLVDARVTGVDFRYDIDFVWLVVVALLVLLYAVDAELHAAPDGTSVVAEGPSMRRTVHSLVFGWFVAGVTAAFLFLFFKQFAEGMNMPVAIRWNVASWFLFL